MLAGGFDDLTPEGMIGFGDMGATASSDDLDAMGIAPHEASRANDLRRAGFVEAQGGGALLVMRGDVALALGLPVRGVLAYAGASPMACTRASPPLASACSRPRGRLALAQRSSATASPPTTSASSPSTTPPRSMNDPNEADLHDRIQTALDRTPGNPLLVVSQKTVTGHAKGGAAAWQLDGILRMIESGRVPGNPTSRASTLCCATTATSRSATARSRSRSRCGPR